MEWIVIAVIVIVAGYIFIDLREDTTTTRGGRANSEDENDDITKPK